MAEGWELPQIIEDALAAERDGAEAARVRSGFDAARTRPVTLRANTLKAGRAAVADALNQAGIAWEQVPWYADAFVLPRARERAVWDLDAYQVGELYLQSLSSMLPPLVLGARAREDVLDMCAAPGGKTSEIAALEPKAHLTACEMSAPRAEKLSHNLAKLGVTATVMRIDARRLDTFFSFDRILLDAPCTGTGTLVAGDARTASRMTEQLLAKTVRAQQALLDRALTVLKPGGTLVYATCSILAQENEQQIACALKRHRDCTLSPIGAIPEDAAEQQDTPREKPSEAELAVARAIEDGTIPTLEPKLAGTITVCPTERFEGFFVAKIVKGNRGRR